MKDQVRFGCRIFLSAHEPFQRIVQRAQFCEKHGFDSVLIDDNLLYGQRRGVQGSPTLGWIVLDQSDSG